MCVFSLLRKSATNCWELAIIFVKSFIIQLTLFNIFNRDIYDSNITPNFFFFFLFFFWQTRVCPNCRKNSMKWIRNWLLMWPLEHDLKWWKSLSPTYEMIENMSFGLNIELGFNHVWTRPTYLINNNILLFYLLSQ